MKVRRSILAALAPLAIAMAFIAGMLLEPAGPPPRLETPPPAARPGVPRNAAPAVNLPEPLRVSPTADIVRRPRRDASQGSSSGPLRRELFFPERSDPGRGTVVAFVTDARDRPVAGVIVRAYPVTDEDLRDAARGRRMKLWDRAGAGVGTSDANGILVIPRLERPAEYVLVTASPHIVETERRVALIGEEARISLRVEPGGAVELILVEPDPESPSRDAVRFIATDTRKVAVAALAGHAEDAGRVVRVGWLGGDGLGRAPRLLIGGLSEGRSWIDVRARGYARQHIECDVFAGRTIPVHVVCSRGASAEVFLTEGRWGGTLKEGEVVIADEVGTPFEAVARARPDPEGRFVVEGLDPGRMTLLRAYHPAFHAIDIPIHAPLEGPGEVVHGGLTVPRSPSGP